MLFRSGATSRGSVHECMNLASVWDLPVLFFCENNGYGMSASSDRMVSTDAIAKRAEGYNIDYEVVDGNDVEAVYVAAKKAVDQIRRTGRPYFLEVKTYRLCGHSKSDSCVYRSREEESLWLQREPIALFSKAMVESSLFSEEDVASIILDAMSQVDEAARGALERRSSVLSLEQAMGYLFAPEDEAEAQLPNGITTRRISYREAIREAMDEEMGRDAAVHLIEIGRASCRDRV